MTAPRVSWGLLILQLMAATISTRKDGSSVMVVQGLLVVPTAMRPQTRAASIAAQFSPAVLNTNHHGVCSSLFINNGRGNRQGSFRLFTTNDSSTASQEEETSPKKTIGYLSRLLLGVRRIGKQRRDSSSSTNNSIGLVSRRLLVVSGVMVSSFATYLLGSTILNRIVVSRLGVSRCGDAFGPFATLLSLIYSIVLGQIYDYYFERQQMIQNSLYEEASALQLLFHVVTATNNSQENQSEETSSSTALEEETTTNEEQHDARRSAMFAPLKAYTQNFLQTAFSTKSSYKLRPDVPQQLVDVSNIYDDTMTASSSSPSRTILVSSAITAALSARALRTAHVNSDLPVVQKITERLLSYVILGGFILVDLNAPMLEGLLFSVLAGCFTTIHGFLMDLSDPFSGQWAVGTHIRKDLEEMIELM